MSMKDLLAIQVAKLAHTANKLYCESLGDTSQVDWDKAPENIKASAVNGVLFKLNNPGITPENSHENWLKFKSQDGWVYGDVKDEKAKTHPCMVQYSDLPEEQRVKDHLFTSICSAFVKQYREAV